MKTWTAKMRNAIIAASLSAALAIGGGKRLALDRFVIEHVEVTNVAALEAASGTDSAALTTGTSQVSQNEYTSDNTTIKLSTYTKGSGSDQITYYVADVTLSDAAALRSAFAKDSYGENITAKVSQIATDNNAVFAINGDYYGFRDNGIVIRNGVLYRDEGTRQGLAIYSDGHMEIYDETVTSGQELLDAGVINTLSFGPAMVSEGQIIDGIEDVEVDTNFGNHSIQGSQPRTAIGQIAPGHFLFVVVDGRQSGYSRGATMSELAQIMVDLGAQTAYNLDGGGSSEMWFDGQVVNQPSNGGERATSDILYIGSGS